MLFLTSLVLVQLSAAESILERSCPKAGVFPHPKDDSQFLICAEDHGTTFVAATVPCPEGYVFCHTERTCVSGQCLSVSGRLTRQVTGGPCKTSGPSCEGCDRLVVCANTEDKGLTPIYNESCSNIDVDMGCSKSACTTEVSSESCDGSDRANSFRCLQPGYFPDPKDCKRFHVCGRDLSHYSGDCDEQYDANLETCTSVDQDSKQGATKTGDTQSPAAQQCTNVQNPCTGSNVAPVRFPNYPSFYVICLPVATKGRKSSYVYQLSVGKCPGRQEFNEKTFVCEFTCTGKRGRFQDPDNCHSYIECTTGSAGVKKSCQDNLAFDPDRKFCLPEAMVKTCQRTTTTTTTTTITKVSAVTPPALVNATTPAVQTPTTTQTPTISDFQCKATGAYPDKTDCHKFITCSLVSRSDGYYFAMSRKECPFFTHFNSNGYCEYGLCWNWGLW